METTEQARSHAWEPLYTDDLVEAQVGFLQLCMTENLEHARHVENERLTFNSIYMALAAASLAFSSQLGNNLLSAAVCFILLMAGFLAMLLTKRWDNAFDRHLSYAKRCYALLHKRLFSNADRSMEDSIEYIDGLNALPFYCFRIKNPTIKYPAQKLLYSIRTRYLFSAFYWLIQIVLMLSIAYFIMLEVQL